MLGLTLCKALISVIFARYFIEMISLEQIKDLQERVLVLGRCIDVEAKRADVAQRTERTLAADFWDDPKSAEEFLKEQ
mgnify:CR=1 FL=1